MNRSFIRSNAAVIALAAMATALPAKAAHYEFRQSGYRTTLHIDNQIITTFHNGVITGSFNGADSMDIDGNAVNDGVIIGANNENTEISSFSIKFSGNPYFDSFYRDNSYYDEFRLAYDIKNNSLALDLSWEGSHSPHFMTKLTGYTFFDYTSSTVLSLAQGKGQFNSRPFFVDGYDQEGNPIDTSKDFFLDSTSNGQMVVSMTPTPLPGALLFFASGLAGLFLAKRKSA